MTDFSKQFQTPVFAAKYMVSLIPPGIKTVLEPTPGEGRIVRLLKERDYEVTAPKDFFLLDKNLRFDCIVMNPPFSKETANLENAPASYKSKNMRIGYHIFKDCMRMSDNIIAIMPWFTLIDSDVRQKQLKGFGIKSVTCLPRRTFEYIRVQTAVIHLAKGWNEPTIFEVYDLLPKQKSKQLKMII